MDDVLFFSLSCQKINILFKFYCEATMKKTIPFMLSAIALVLNTPAMAEKKWEGMYFGGTFNATESKSKAQNTYSNDGASPTVGWSQDKFSGDLLNSVKSMHVAGHPIYEDVDSIDPTPWGVNISSSKNITGGGALFGINTQREKIVLGGEVRLNFGNFGAEPGQSFSSTGTKSQEFEGNLSFTNYHSSLTGISSPISNPDTSNSLDYTQTNRQQNSIKYDYVTQLVGRVGYSFGDVMLYGAAGLAVANVKATTATTIQETVEGRYAFTRPLPPTGGTSYTGSATYNFAGNSSKNMMGFAVGGGAEWMLKEDISFRAEAMYYDLGKIDVVGRSDSTSATYRVSQSVTAYNFGISIIKRF